MTLTITKLADHLGAEVSGADLTQVTDDVVVA